MLSLILHLAQACWYAFILGGSYKMHAKASAQPFGHEEHECGQLTQLTFFHSWAFVIALHKFGTFELWRLRQGTGRLLLAWLGGLLGYSSSLSWRARIRKKQPNSRQHFKNVLIKADTFFYLFHSSTRQYLIGMIASQKSVNCSNHLTRPVDSFF